jgi:hypothetical protein
MLWCTLLFRRTHEALQRKKIFYASASLTEKERSQSFALVGGRAKARRMGSARVPHGVHSHKRLLRGPLQTTMIWGCGFPHGKRKDGKP